MIWVEIKHGSEPGWHQLDDYSDAMRENCVAGRGVVFLLAPRDDYATYDRASLETVPQLTWEDTAAALAVFEPCGDVAKFLVNDLRAYLEEEGLSGRAHGSLERRVLTTAARAAVRSCVEQMIGRVERLWAPQKPDGMRSYGKDQFWWDFPNGRSAEMPAQPPFLVELFFRPIYRDVPPGVPVLVVGTNRPRGGLSSMSLATAEALVEADFHVHNHKALIGSQWDRIWARKTLDDPTVLASDEGQAELAADMANWTVAKMDRLSEILRRAG